MKLVIRIVVFAIFPTLFSTATFGKNLYITNCKTDVYPTRAEIPHLSVCTLPKGTPVEVLKMTQEVDGIWCRIRVHTKDSECTGWVKKMVLWEQTESERLRLKQWEASSVGEYYLSREYYLSENRPTYLRKEPYETSFIIVVVPNETPLRIITPRYNRQLKYLKVEVHIGIVKYDGWIRRHDIEKNNTANAEKKWLAAEKKRLAEIKKVKRKRLAEIIEAKKRRLADIREAKKRRLADIRELEARVKLLLITNYKGNYTIYNKLLALDPKNTKYKQKVIFYKKKMAEEKERSRKLLLQRGYVLKLLSWHWDHNSGYAIVQGEVQNITNKRLENIQALVSWYDKDGEFITSDSSFLDYQVLMPGQKSPFKIYTNFNPQMYKASLEFKYYFGGRIKIN